MIVLDTNVISELMRPRGEPRVIAWMDQLQAGEVYLTAITTAELRYGVARLPDGRRKTELANRIQLAIEEDFTGRILSFDDHAAARYANIVTSREQRGLAISMADAQIAAIRRHHLSASMIPPAEQTARCCGRTSSRQYMLWRGLARSSPTPGRRA